MRKQPEPWEATRESVLLRGYTNRHVVALKLSIITDLSPNCPHRNEMRADVPIAECGFRIAD
ncbi:MAG: hypothetical protein M3R15_26275 [Acidobacteriota bacterium]|nr:hypothetical protein [Acidobacteriota bacterium]